jgi:hypothetical protein
MASSFFNTGAASGAATHRRWVLMLDTIDLHAASGSGPTDHETKWMRQSRNW